MTGIRDVLSLFGPERHRCRSVWLGLGLSLFGMALSCPDLTGQDQQTGVFDTAIAYAQERMVKVYGATAGRVDGYASGVIVSAEGHIVTMQGVFLDGQATRVTLPDGRQVPATVLRRNRELQLALLKIEDATPQYFELSENDVGRQGDWVMALSNAFKVADGVEPLSVNLGIISLRTSIEARLNERDIAYRGPLVLIDAITSNPGAGGGAVVTIDGQLVGTIGRVISSSETNTRLNYAVPASVVKAFVEGSFENEQDVMAETQRPGDLGIRLFRFGSRSEPAYIDRVQRGSPAAAAQLRPDDLVISVGGTRIGSIAEYDNAMKDVFEGVETIVVVKRGSKLIRIPLIPDAVNDENR